jgi:hypothetical protein
MTLTCIFAAWLLAAAPPAPAASPEPTGPCPVGRSHSCALELKGTKAPAIPSSCLTPPWSSYLTFEQPSKLSNADVDLWWESVVRINLDPAGGCSCAVFVVTFEERPSGFTVDIGDSPTNDGWGGDAGTTRWSAEANVEGDTVSIFSDSTGRKVDKLLTLRLPALAGRTLSLKVCDESFSAELEKLPSEPQSLVADMSFLTFQHLFALGGQAISGDPDGPRVVDYNLYAAFNRVIHVRGGSPAKGRTGKGVKRAEIYLTP